MDNKTNKERLATIEGAIINIDKNVDEIKKDNKEQWKQINKNAQDIASQKSFTKVISGFVVGIVISVIGIVWSKYK